MQFFLDTANIDQIREAADWGMLNGVTTNPSLIAKEDGKFEDIIQEICRVVPGPVSVECISVEAKPIIEEARRLAALADNVVIKIPIFIEGLKAIKVLSEEGIPVNTTLIFSPNQALLAAKAGARYVSPFIGRLDDISHDGMELVEQIVVLLNNYGFDTEVIAASIRHPRHVLDAAMMGADIATIPFGVLKQLIRHPLTDIGMEKFLNDWKKVQGR
ncbi:MAG: fructose-6-phosphate aldolase [Acidobacteria bacterium]|nr:fructose-6-phosphate aldolase [Acidobacteriota bacterium]MCG2816289.1 fructose-6-phosphate aldolase [Candidatus Aminicenantes bacterium]MBU1338490.1 fructose-6-phosphate aldolase [Acidobacteriota bacterium]MBU1475302.1 fructose-6-phosphate aldolase [Acidobacteriota bacterium]MBU4255527.1 fructose-6-phosphate aldolase [Acidobacteriota bacterium]